MTRCSSLLDPTQSSSTTASASTASATSTLSGLEATLTQDQNLINL